MLFDRLSTGFSPTETPRLLANRLIVPLERTIVYTYDPLYRLTEADYSTGELYEYDYDPAGNRLEQIINGDTTVYTYDAANRLATVDGQSYTFDDNGNLLQTGILTNVFDTANRLTSTVRAGTTVLPKYNGLGDRVAQTVGTTTTYFALDVIGLPEVISTSTGSRYLHLPGVIMAENNAGEVRYLLSDGLGSIRQAVDETGEVVSSDEYDPYGNPLTFHASRFTPYGFTGEWWEQDVGLLHLRARWYLAETGTFVSRDAWEGDRFRPQSLNGWSYVESNPIRYLDPSGLCPLPGVPECDNPWLPIQELWEYPGWAIMNPAKALELPKTSLKSLMLEGWLFERGKTPRTFDSSHPITQLVMRHEGVNAARAQFYLSGCRSMTVENNNPFDYNFKTDSAFYHSVEGPPYLSITIPRYEFREKPLYPYGPVEFETEVFFNRRISLGGAYKFTRGNAILFYEIFTASEDTLETIDGTLGSYRVEILNNGDDTATFEVYNKTGRESFTRDYAYPALAFFSDRTRQETRPFLIFSEGWGGDLRQHIRWAEDLPAICQCSID